MPVKKFGTNYRLNYEKMRKVEWKNFTFIISVFNNKLLFRIYM